MNFDTALHSTQYTLYMFNSFLYTNEKVQSNITWGDGVQVERSQF